MKFQHVPIFILGAAKYDSPLESTSYTIARHLAKNHQVFYIDYPFTWKDCIRLRNTPEYRNRKPAFEQVSARVRDTDIPSLKVMILPPVPSINFLPEGGLYRYLLGLIEKKICKEINRVVKERNLGKILYINSYNFHYPGVANGLPAALKVYHCVDPLVVPYDRRHGIRSEEQLVRESDLVICTSKQLAEEKGRLNRRTFFIPNAADILHSRKALDPELPVHQKLAVINRPVIGYFGNIERRMDFPLLRGVIEAHPDKNFVFAGPVAKEEVPEWFFKASNIHFPGRLPYAEMPAMVKGFDIAIIPFKKDEHSRTIFPLKLFEYLGAGKPVVATDFNPDLKDFTGDTVWFCKDSASFSQAIFDILTGQPDDGLADRLSVAEANTWSRRAAELEEILAANYPHCD